MLNSVGTNIRQNRPIQNSEQNKRRQNHSENNRQKWKPWMNHVKKVKNECLYITITKSVCRSLRRSLLPLSLTRQQTNIVKHSFVKTPLSYLLVPALLQHLTLNIGCPEQLVLLLLSSNEGRQIWSRATGAGWWAVWASSLRKLLCLCVCAVYLLIFQELLLKTFVHSFVAWLKTASCTRHQDFMLVVTRWIETGWKSGDGFSLSSWDLTIFDNRWLNVV